ncbi:hypothetical protein jhhlp_008797, partial [Lomentospora prolificans]
LGAATWDTNVIFTHNILHLRISRSRIDKMANSKIVKVGVFIPTDTQLLDTACVDIFGMLSKDYMEVLEDLPKHLVGIAPVVKIFYISASPVDSPLTLTAGVRMLATHHISDADVQPGKLDILLIPGPDPRTTFEEPVLEFVRAHHKQENTDILSVCTGILLCGAAGLLDGRTACGPRGMQPGLRKKWPTAKLVGEKYRWIQDGNLWSSGGITNGNDLVAAYCRTGKHFPGPLVEIVCKMADVGDRPHEYEQGQTAFTISFVWQLFRSMFVRK